MKRINKTSNRDTFNIYSKDYLSDNQNKKGVFVPNLSDKKSFKKFSDKKYKTTAHPAGSTPDGWLKILLDETEGLCCYCMRHLPADEVSVEHLIPENFGGLENTDEFQEYEYYAQNAPDILNNVVLGSVFDEEAKRTFIDIEGIIRYTHLVAHSNLFPACQDNSPGCSCNRHRDNNRILPMMLIDGIENKVEYTPEGKMELHHEDDQMVKQTLTHLDINSPTLISIRKLWYKFSRKGVFCEWNHTVTYPEMDNMVRIALDLAITDIIPSEYWDLLKEESDGSLKNFQLFLQYNWFYTYYLNKYPLQQP